MRRLLQHLRIRPYAIVGAHFIEPCAERVTAHLRCAEYESADALMAQVAAEDLDPLLWRLVDGHKVGEHAVRWVNAVPESSHAHLLLGFSEIARAWNIRGEYAYEDIPRARRRKFPKVMERGYQHLFELSERDRGCAMAFAGMIHCSRVIGIGQESRKQWLDHVMEVVPFHVPTLLNYAHTTQARWGGSEQEMVEFALWVSEHAPAGHLAHVVMANAILELAFSLTEHPADVVRLRRQLGGHELAGWMRQALLSWLNVGPDQLHQRLKSFDVQTDVGFARVALERFALASYFAGAMEESRMLFMTLKGRISRDPWEQFSFQGSRMDSWTGMDKAYMGVTHDRICRDLGLDLKKLCW